MKYEDFRNPVKELRKRINITQRELARRMNCSTTTIGNIENYTYGVIGRSVYDLPRLAEALEVSPFLLLWMIMDKPEEHAYAAPRALYSQQIDGEGAFDL